MNVPHYVLCYIKLIKTDFTGDQYEYCVAMYDYEATAEEELTFEEGTVLRVLRKNVHSVDDGWWEGEMITEEGNSVIGLFPSLVIQECGPDGEPLSTEVHLCEEYFKSNLNF